ncbi:MAG: mechanosensitive ion channel family protein [Asticcacaulis sp.]|uniref:mechanosensitive ion channel family protein n=1 Tax=Asticcacaulis sp. TaxID=1872648 RepID=UPI0039E6111A
MSAAVATSSVAASAGIATPEQTLSERLIGGVTSLWEHLSHLSLEAIAVNAVLSVVVALVFWGVAWAVSAGLYRLVGRAHMPGENSLGLSLRKALRFTRTIIVFAAGVVAISCIASVWGIDLFALMSASMASKLTHTLLALLIVLVITAVAFEAAGLLIGYFLSRLKSRKDMDLRRGAQIDTLGPIVRRSLQAVILVLGVMMFLSQLGVQIAPLLAGAGVVGIAVGFGAQTLVKDFFTGFFLLIEDIIAVGDIVTIGSSTGAVENMTLRYISLRDADGTLHVFPYGEAQIIHNQTKAFSRYVFDLPLALDTDLDKVEEILSAASARIQAEEAWKDLILEPIEILGVDSLADFGLILKARVTTQANARWKVGREFNRRIKAAFEAAGIAITHKGAYAP